MDNLVLIELVGYEFFIFGVFRFACQIEANHFYGEFGALFYILTQTSIIFMESLILAQSERWRRA